jgi:ATP-dependent Clp protease ATP-binding subunit ClpB
MSADTAYSDDLKKSIQIAQALAKENLQPKFSGAHLLRALLHKDIGLIPLLEGMGKDFFYMQDWADVRIEELPKAAKPVETPLGDDKVGAAMLEADNIRIKLNKESIDPVCVLASLVTPGVAFTYEQLKSFPVTQAELVSAQAENASIQQAVFAPKAGSPDQATKQNALLKYCRDKSALAKEGKLDPIIGRDKETRMVAEILCRRTKPNVMIIGEPGVGKTALVDGFVLSIEAGRVPDLLRNARVFELDFGSLVAGAAYKGEVEERLKGILTEIKQFEKAILFIDEIHALVDAKGSNPGIANILKPELARGELTLIGATTLDEYRKNIEKDEAFSRRFEIVVVNEPDEQITVKMLQHIMPLYEKHHKLTLSADAPQEAVRLAKRYLKERRLPDSAIDLIDRTMSVVRLMSETSATEIVSLQERLKNILADTAPDDAALLKNLRWLHTELDNKLSHVLIGQLDDHTKIETLENAEELSAHLTSILDRLAVLAGNKKAEVDKQDLATVVAHKTGIPIGKVQTGEKERLLTMDTALKGRVIGQDHALKSIAEAVLENRSGLGKPGQPIGSFFFLGSTGTGKTELAKSIAEFLFGQETAMIRFDMSEFKEEHSAALLYGAPPGYVGYEEGGVLVNKIRQQPYAVVLFDEIEKAHPSVFDIFLQILDEGKMHDRLGKEGDFSNAIIIFTSNIGAETIVKEFEQGKIPKSNELMEIMQKHFRPEFLARITEIVPFAPVNENTISQIFDIHYKSLLKTLDRMGITLTITDEARKKLAMEGYSPRYGVRPLTGVIRNRLRRPLSRMIIAGQVTKGTTAHLSVRDDELDWQLS